MTMETNNPPMTAPQRAVAELLTRLINKGERDCDGTLHTVGSLLIALPELRRHGRIPAELSQPALERVMKAAQLVTRARQHLLSAHTEMSASAARMDFETFTGDVGKPRDPPQPSGELVPFATTKVAA